MSEYGGDVDEHTDDAADQPQTVLVAPLNRGDGTVESLIFEVADKVENLVDTINNTVAHTFVAILERLEALEEQDEKPKVPVEKWADWLRVSYNLDHVIPANWDEQRGVSQEVRALHALWCSAYKKNGTPLQGSAANSFHEALDRARQRITDYAAHTNAEKEIPPAPGT